MKVSIITVTFNSAETLENTIKSVLDQSYKNIEYIIVDGGSNDGTVDIIKKYENNISKWISEPDKGIYDAMNKGFNMVTGDIIYWLNSDDIFFDKNIIDKIVSEFRSDNNIDFIYGKILVKSSKNKYSYIDNRTLSPLGVKLGNKVSQQAFFIKKQSAINLLEDGKLFDTNFKIAGDYDLECRVLKSKVNFKFSNLIMCTYSHDGISSNLQKSYSDSSKVILKNFGYFFYSLYLVKSWIKLFLINTLRNLNLLNSMIKIFYEK